MIRTPHISFTKFDSLIQLTDFFDSEDKCKAAIAQERWGNGEVVCPYCGSTHCHMYSDGRYICKGCQRKFSVLVGTIFENTKISLRKWFMAMYLISSHKKGVSSCQLSRDLGFTQKTAWFILLKIRGLYGQSDPPILMVRWKWTKCTLAVVRATSTNPSVLRVRKVAAPRRRLPSSGC